MYTRHLEDEGVDKTHAICDFKPHSLREEAAIVITHTIFHNSHKESGSNPETTMRSSERNPHSGPAWVQRGARNDSPECRVFQVSTLEGQEKQEGRPLDQPERVKAAWVFILEQ